MKQLDTLIEDIYSSIEPLCQGESLNISDEEVDVFAESMKKVIVSWARPSKRDSNFNVRMSNVGRPLRQLWYESKSEVKNVVNPPTMIKFLYGHLLEEVLLMLVRVAGHTVTDEQKEIELNGIKGHMDCKINGEVVDVKTASSFAFRKFKYGSLAEDDPFGYLAQLAGYEEAEGTEEGGFLVINKETGELCLHRPEDLDKPNAGIKIKNIDKVLKRATPPEELCYEPVAEGTKGNMRIHKNCSYCAFKFKCFKDVNDGEGLRGFKYSKGVTYFTKLVSIPKVEEVL